MPDDPNIPISRDDLTFTVHMALPKAEHLWPKRRLPGDHDRLKLVADSVIDHLELCGMRCFRKAPKYGEPHFNGAARRSGEDDADGA